MNRVFFVFLYIVFFCNINYIYANETEDDLLDLSFKYIMSILEHSEKVEIKIKEYEKENKITSKGLKIGNLCQIYKYNLSEKYIFYNLENTDAYDFVNGQELSELILQNKDNFETNFQKENKIIRIAKEYLSHKDRMKERLENSPCFGFSHIQTLDKVKYNIYLSLDKSMAVATIADPRKPIFRGGLKEPFYKIQVIKTIKIRENELNVAILKDLQF
jgi:hypothetical protein